MFWTLLTVVLSLCRGADGQVDRFATCDTQIPGAKIPACYCDKLCMLLKDCCFEYNNKQTVISKNETQSEADSVDISTCEHIIGQPYNVFMVTKLATLVPRFDAACKFPNRRQPHQVLPVYDTKLGVTYRNSYCYTIYQRSKGIEPISSDYVLWTIETTNNCYQKLYTLYLRTEKFLSITMLIRVLLSQSNCTITLKPPKDSKTRICFQHNEEECPFSNECLSYQSPVTNSAGEFFKNIHCAVCANPDAQYEDVEKGLTKAGVKETILSFTYCKLFNMGVDSVCQTSCRNEGELQYLGNCLTSFVEVRGLVHSINIQIGDNVFHDSDGQKTRQIINRYIDIGNGINVTATLNTNALLCRNFVIVDVFFRENVEYQQYLNMTSATKQAMIMHTADIEENIRNLSIPNSYRCPVKHRSTKDTVRTMRSTIDQLKFAIFSAAFGGFVLAFIILVSIKAVLRRCKSESDSESNEVD